MVNNMDMKYKWILPFDLPTLDGYTNMIKVVDIDNDFLGSNITMVKAMSCKLSYGPLSYEEMYISPELLILHGHAYDNDNNNIIIKDEEMVNEILKHKKDKPKWTQSITPQFENIRITIGDNVLYGDSLCFFDTSNPFSRISFRWCIENEYGYLHMLGYQVDQFKTNIINRLV